MDDLGAESRAKVVQWLRYARGRRQQHIIATTATISDMLESRFTTRPSFTASEVATALQDLKGTISEAIEREMTLVSHASAGALQQTLHLLLKNNNNRKKKNQKGSKSDGIISGGDGFDGEDMRDIIRVLRLNTVTLEDGARMAAIARLEHDALGGGSGDGSGDGSGGGIHGSNSSGSSSSSSSNSGGGTGVVVGGRVPVKSRRRDGGSGVGGGDTIPSLRAEVAALKRQLTQARGEAERWGVATSSVPTAVATAAQASSSGNSEELEMARARIAELEMELEAKFNKTAQYVNMRKMLEAKNAQIKELRSSS